VSALVRLDDQLDLADDENVQIISYSELSTFRQCPLKHHLSYQRRWTKSVKAGGALDKGITWHNAMEAHYKVLQASKMNGRRRTPDQVKRALVACRKAASVYFAPDPDTGEQSDVKVLVEWMYDGYVKKWGINENWKILGVEHQIKTPLLDNQGRVSRYVLKAKLDLVILDLTLGTIWVVDHKSGGDLPTQLDMELDDQFGLYGWAMRQMGRPVQGAIHSAARTTRNKGDWPGQAHGNAKEQTLEQRFRHTLISRGQKELDNLALDAFNAAQAAYPPEGHVRSIYSSPNPRSCGWMCDMRDAHLLMRSGREPDAVMREQGYVVDFTRH
jgi:hypothetical protein